MNLFILIIAAIAFFTILTLLRKWKDLPVLIATAIACAVNTNYYLNIDCPVNVGPFVFGVDALIALMFVFIIMIIFVDYSAKQAMTVTINSCVAIVLAGVIEMFAVASTLGEFTFECVRPILFYSITVAGSMIGCSLAIWLGIKMKNANKYLVLAITTLIACVFHSIFYNVGYILIEPEVLDNTSTFIGAITGGLIEKVALIPLGLLSYFIGSKVLKIQTSKN